MVGSRVLLHCGIPDRWSSARRCISRQFGVCLCRFGLRLTLSAADMFSEAATVRWRCQNPLLAGRRQPVSVCSYPSDSLDRLSCTELVPTTT
eukprot:277411-Pyramimonas_sp.AAC.1